MSGPVLLAVVFWLGASPGADGVPRPIAAQTSPPVGDGRQEAPSTVPVSAPVVTDIYAPAADASGQTSSQPPATTADPVDVDKVWDIVITARSRDPRDPFAAVNVQSFVATAAVDAAIGAPAALAYKRTIPSPIRSGIRNFFNNLHEPVVFFNFLLQHKFGKAGETLARFTINSTIGGAGLFDLAKRRPFKLPRRPNGFADTLGFYGVKPGPFFYVPLLGPTTLRDLAGGFIDRLFVFLPLGTTFKSPAFKLSTGVVRGLDHRAEIDDRIRTLRDGPENDYDASRDFYLKRRQAEIDQLRGKPAPAGIRDPGATPVAPRVANPFDAPAP
jgi:phospholipid-binding lipoprotein MlaA